jgi:transcriptional regulator GlxA family with amidase domain
MRTVALVAFSGVQSLDVSGPLDVFAEANRFLLPDAHYRLEVVGLEHGPIRCSNGMTIFADRHFSDAHDAYDLLLVAGGPGLVHQEFADEIYTWLQRASRKAQRFGSICSGAFILARAGLLDRRKVTTHWNYSDALTALCPTACVEADRLYVEDGSLYTSAGVTAGIDLCLYLLTRDKGNEVALNVAKRLVVFMHRTGGQSQFSPYLTPYAEGSSPIAHVQQYVLSNLTGDLSVGVLARVANMSVRTFARAFARDAKIPPAEFVEGARMDAARDAGEHRESLENHRVRMWLQGCPSHARCLQKTVRHFASAVSPQLRHARVLSQRAIAFTGSSLPERPVSMTNATQRILSNLRH